MPPMMPPRHTIGMASESEARHVSRARRPSENGSPSSGKLRFFAIHQHWNMNTAVMMTLGMAAATKSAAIETLDPAR